MGSPKTAAVRAAASGPPGRASSAGLGRESLADRLALRLSARIEGGALGPGDRLPTEAQLGAEYGVSRSVVREAVHRIKSRGLLVSRQGSGVYVAQGQPGRALEFDPSVLGSVDAYVQIVEVRRVMEGEIAALAAARATPAQLAALKRALAAIDAASAAGRDGVDEDLRFHRLVGEATGNPQFGRLLGFLEQYLRDGMRVTRANEARRLDFMRAVQREHRAIFDAIAARDATAARRAARRHLVQGERRLERGGVLGPRGAGATSRRQT